MRDHRSPLLDKYLDTPVTVELQMPGYSGTLTGRYMHNHFILNYWYRPGYVFIEKGSKMPSIAFCKSHVKHMWLADGSRVK
jgi:hypothetical protein